MKRLLGIMLVLNIVLILVGCGEDSITITPPTYQGVLIDGESPVSEGVLQTFYKQKEEPILVQVNIANPSNTAITSIKINGINYRANRFTENSTNTMIVFEMLAPNSNGEHLFEVDEVIYQDGALMKSVNVESNNQFEVFVYKDIPILTRVDYQLEKDAVSITFSLVDTNQTIVEGSAVVRVYTNNALIDEEPLSVGTQTVVFDNLFTDQQYEVRVYADYDLEDGEGVRTEQVLYEDVYTTGNSRQPSAQIERIQLFENRIVFDVTLVDPDNTLLENGLRVALFKDDTLITEQLYDGSVDDALFDDLFSNSSYSVRVYGTYDLRDGDGVVEEFLLTQYTFITEVQYVPEPNITNLNVEDNNITFNVDLNDPNNVFDLDTVQAHIYLGDQLVLSTDVLQDDVRMQVYDLLSSFTFTLVLTSNYDLNDGEGMTEDAEIFRQEYTTTGNVVPSISVTDPVVRQGYVDVEYTVEDPDDTITTLLTGILYENGVEVARVNFSKENNTFTFAYPVVYTSVYSVELLTDYNLYDGSGTKQNIRLYTTTLLSLNPKAPTVEVHETVVESDEIQLDLTVLDADETIVDGTLKAILLLDGVVIDEIALTSGTNNITFDQSVYSNTQYKIRIVSNIDLNEDTGIRTNVLIGQIEATTIEKVMPEVAYDNMISTYDSIAFELLVEDSDSVIVSGSLRAQLYSATTLIASVDILDEADFDLLYEMLLSNKTYRIEIVADVDLQDQQGLQEDVVIGEFTGSTLAKSIPSASINDTETTYTSVILDIQIFDETNSIVDGTIYAELYIDDVASGVIISLSEGINSNVTFGTLLSGKEYQVRVYATYNLNDGSAAKEKMLDFDYATTLEKTVPTSTIINVETSETSFTFDVAILDPTSALVSNSMFAVLYLNDVEVDRVALVKGNNIGVSFDQLLSNTSYKIEILVGYNLNEGDLDAEEVIEDRLVKTDAKTAPTATISEIVTDDTSVTFDVSLLDPSDTLVDATMFVVLYLDDTELSRTAILTGNNTDITFNGLYSNTTYDLRIEVAYNLNEGNLDIEKDITTAFITTKVKTIPTSSITNISSDYTSITLDASLVDLTNALVNNSMFAVLYLDGVEQERIAIVKGNNTSIVFDDLLSNTEYEIHVEIDYNLNEGDGILSTSLTSELITTEEKNEPYVGVISSTNTDITFDVVFETIDTTSSITGNLKAQILLDGIVIDEQIITVDQTTVTFSGLLANTAYTFRVIADYNLNEGDPDETSYVLGSTTFTTEAILDITDLVIEKEKATFTVGTLDPYDRLDNTNYEIKLYDKNGLQVGRTITIIGTTEVELLNLYSDNVYSFTISAMYGGLIEVVHTETLTTIAQDIPTVVIANYTYSDDGAGNYTIAFDIDGVSDPDGILQGPMTVTLYVCGPASDCETTPDHIHTGTVILDADNAFSFSGVTPVDGWFVVVVTADVDLNDGDGIVTYEFASKTHIYAVKN